MFIVFAFCNENDKRNQHEAIRIKREARLLNDSIHGTKASVTFAEAAVSYLTSGGSRRYLGGQRVDGSWSGLIGHFYNKPIWREARQRASGGSFAWRASRVCPWRYGDGAAS